MRKKSKLVYGVGVNDADYNVNKYETIDGKKKNIWSCPFYQKWKGMLARCYSEKVQKRQPTYVDSYTVPEWHYFMTFRNWMEQQHWEGKQLDKDILLNGNKIYGPDTCVFVEQRVNSFLLESTARRGKCPIGSSFNKSAGKYEARCNDIFTGKNKHLGHYLSAEEAHQAWLAFKLEQAYILAAEQTDPRVAKALIDRYENYANLD